VSGSSLLLPPNVIQPFDLRFITAGEMHDVSLPKVAEVTGADAVLFVTVVQYASEYHLITSETDVHVTAKLVDTRTGILLWQGEGVANLNSGYSSDPVEMLVKALLTQVIDSSTDQAHAVSVTANYTMIFDDSRGLPNGPYSSKYESQRTTYIHGSDQGDTR
jgi:hypothetical protein